MKRKYILSGGNTGRFKFTPNWRQNVYGFENNSNMFSPELWTGEYIFREDVFKNPGLLDGCNLWILVTEWGYKNRPEILNAIRYAKSKGVIVGSEQNGPYYATLLCTSPGDTAVYRECSYIQNISNDPTVYEVIERKYGVPYFSSPLPIIREHFEHDYANVQLFDLPYNPNEYFVFGHNLSDINYCTLQVAECFGIPLIVNVWSRDSGFGAWIKAVENEGGFKHVKFTDHLSHKQWLYQMKNSKGVFYLTFHPSGGRPMLYAAMADKISLSVKSGWQQLLFPNSILSPDFTSGTRWDERVLKAEEEKHNVKNRIDDLTPIKCQQRFESFLSKNGWGK